MCIRKQTNKKLLSLVDNSAYEITHKSSLTWHPSPFTTCSNMLGNSLLLFLCATRQWLKKTLPCSTMLFLSVFASAVLSD
jgi:hypothetical protein